MTFETPPDPDLMDWNEIPEVNWAGILIGNGASRAVWDDFRYDSLFAIAQSPNIEHPMTQDIVALFAGLGTRSFERVLHALGTTAIVSEALGLDGQRPRDVYASVQRALIEAVRSIHPQWNQVPEGVLTAIRDALRDYEWVYSTNYDLLAYWSIMADGQAEGFRDFFWNTGGLFDPTNTSVQEDGDTLILYLHGALHNAIP